MADLYSRLIYGALRSYKLTLSLVIGRQCRFAPTLLGIRRPGPGRAGPARGSWLALKRLCRCRPGRAWGYDPPPRARPAPVEVRRMIDLQFPDGSVRPFPEGTTGRQVAASIAMSLEKRAVLVKLDGALLDLERPLPHGGKFEILTAQSPEALDVLRHDARTSWPRRCRSCFPAPR